MKIEISKDMARRLLLAIQAGTLDTANFPELDILEVNFVQYTPEERDAEIQRLKAKLFDDGNSTD